MKLSLRAASVQTYARITGVLFLISLVAGGFGEAFVPSKLIVPADATATANNILASRALFRLGFAGYLIKPLRRPPERPAPHALPN